MADNDGKISFKELVEVRREEMRGFLPNFRAEVKMGDKLAVVYSPRPLEKSTYKVKE